jgi:hemerythrin-like metal-binding protein
MPENIDELDDQHRHLLNRIDQLCEKLKGANLEHEKIFLISEIHAVVAAHFKKEESIMKRQHDDNITGHKVEHDGLLAEIKNYMDVSTEPDNGNLGQKLSQRCHFWFTAHFEEYDKRRALHAADS